MSQEHNHTDTQKQDRPNKPVVVYIMILFIAAFLLMALSSLMHQRSNTEALGQLQESVSMMQELQTAQEKIIALQDELDATKESLAAAQESDNEEWEAALAEAAALADKQSKTLANTQYAMDLFWQINEAYVLGRNERCRKLIQTLETNVLAPYLPSTSTTDNGRFSPYDRYAEICEALEEPYGIGIKS